MSEDWHRSEAAEAVPLASVREQLTDWAARMPGFPVPLTHLDQGSPPKALRAVLEEQPDIDVRSTSFHVCAPYGDLQPLYCARYYPPEGLPFFHAAQRYLTERGGSAPVGELTDFLKARPDYPLPGSSDWLPRLLREMAPIRKYEGFFILVEN